MVAEEKFKAFEAVCRAPETMFLHNAKMAVKKEHRLRGFNIIYRSIFKEHFQSDEIIHTPEREFYAAEAEKASSNIELSFGHTQTGDESFRRNTEF